MKKMLAAMALMTGLYSLTFGQASQEHSSQENLSDKEQIIRLTQEFVDQNIGKDVVTINNDAKTGKEVGVIDKHGTGKTELEIEKVDIEGGEASVTGHVIFIGQLPNGESYNTPVNLRVKYEKRNGEWRFLSGGISTDSKKVA